MTDTIKRDLARQIDSGQVLVVVGAGVSVGATDNAEAASWTGLIASGIARCEAVAQLPPGWGDRVRAEVASGDLDDLLSAAEKVTQKLGGRNGGEYRLWLRDEVGSLPCARPEVIAELAELGVPLATTNYDGLLEEVTGLRPLTWDDGALVHRFMRGEEERVLHLHGHWESPESVVLGIRSYEDVLGDSTAQALQRAFALTRTLIFVGYGGGLSDPNFSALRHFLAVAFSGVEHRHFRLVREDEYATTRAGHAPGERIAVVSYGDRHEDLAPFLSSLRAKSSERAPARGWLRRSPAEDRRAPDQLRAGDTFADHRIEGLLGRGSVGVVYRARDVAENRMVALKVVSPDLSGDHDFRRRFVDDFDRASGVSHPNVLPLYSAGEEDDALFVSMLLADGPDLARLIARGPGLEPGEALRIIATVAEGLAAHHDRGLVHSNVTPANIFVVGAEGHVYLSGLPATLHRREWKTPGHTFTGFYVGTISYYTPEQLLGRAADLRSDIYVLGLVLYEALWGSRPWEAGSPAELMYAMVSPLPHLTDLPSGVTPEVRDVIEHAMARDPEDRFRSADAFREALLRATAQQWEAP